MGADANALKTAAGGCDSAYLFEGLEGYNRKIVRAVAKCDLHSGLPYQGMDSVAIVGLDCFHREYKPPLVVICSCSDRGEPSHADLTFLTSEGKPLQSVVVTAMDMSEAACLLADSLSSIHLFACRGEGLENAMDAVTCCKSLASSLVRVEGGRNPDDSRRRWESEDTVRRRASRMHVHFLCDDELSAIPVRSLVYETIHRIDNSMLFSGASHTSPKSILTNEQRLTNIAFESMEISPHMRLTHSAWDYFSELPPYEVLALDDGKTESENSFLVISIVCSGKLGVEMLKTAYWMGRISGVQLRVVGVGLDCGTADKLRFECPEMMSELDENGNNVVQLIESAQPDLGWIDSALEGAGKNPALQVYMDFENDEDNLRYALRLREFLSKRILLDKVRCRTVVGLRVRTPWMAEYIENLSYDGSEACNLRAYGSRRDYYPYFKIVDSAWSGCALGVYAATRAGLDITESAGLQVGADKAAAEFRRSQEAVAQEYYACARHMSTRFWAAGTNPDRYITSSGGANYGVDMGVGVMVYPGAYEEGNTEWLGTLGLTPEKAAELLLEDSCREPIRGGRLRHLIEKRKALREELPVLCKLADMEHERWVAYMRSCGWQSVDADEFDRFTRIEVLKGGKRRSYRLRCHAYLCDLDELPIREVFFGDDRYMEYVRLVIESFRIVSGSLFKERE